MKLETAQTHSVTLPTGQGFCWGKTLEARGC